MNREGIFSIIGHPKDKHNVPEFHIYIYNYETWDEWLKNIFKWLHTLCLRGALERSVMSW